MADWDTHHVGLSTFKTEITNGYEHSHSRQSSQGSKTSSGRGHPNGSGSTFSPQRQESLVSDVSTQDNSSERELILRDGRDLYGESRTESCYENSAMFDKSTPEIPGRQPTTSAGTAKAKAARSPYSGPAPDSIPDVEITIPNDANLSSFTADQLASFLKCLKVDDRIISHLHRKNVDGKRFGKLRDSELENLGVANNPVIVWFRDRSVGKAKKNKGPFIL